MILDTTRIKYPRTPHLPWSLGAQRDDIHHSHIRWFENKDVVITEKMDGENTTLYRDFIHARSIDSRFHPSRNWVKALQARIGHHIPHGWRVCGENVFAKHSIEYKNLPSYFLAFSVWDERNQCLSWQETETFLHKLELAMPTVLYRGPWCEKTIKNIVLDSNSQEGYVVRVAESFHYRDFSHHVAKWVRANHVTTDKHWMHSQMQENLLAKHSGKQGILNDKA